MKKLYEKLDTIFSEDVNQLAFIEYESLEWYKRQRDISIHNFLKWPQDTFAGASICVPCIKEC